MEVGHEEERVSVARGDGTAADVHPVDEGKERVLQLHAAQEGNPASPVTLHGPKLWLLLAGIYLGIYLVALELTILSTLSPTLTNEFGAVADISWYESAYVLTLCVFTPVVSKLYEQISLKVVYLSSLALFEAGLLICALATSSPMFIAGRAVNGLGSAGQFGGSLLMIGSGVAPEIRPLVTAVAMSMISVGSMTGPIIAGVIVDRIGWRWCKHAHVGESCQSGLIVNGHLGFWMLIIMGGAIVLVTSFMSLPDTSDKPSLQRAVRALPRTLDFPGFCLFTAAVTMLLLAINWGGSSMSWSSPTILGLVCGGIAVLTVFCWWVGRKGENALISPSCLSRRSVYVGSVLMFLQGGASQAIPFFLPIWFQAIKGDSPRESAVHFLPSLITMVLSLITFGALVRKLRYIPPWAIVGSGLAGIGSGLLTTLKPDTSVGQWVGYQIIISVDRGIAFQVPITTVQEFVPLVDNAVSLGVMNLFMQLGIAVSVSVCQTVFNNRLPELLHRYAPEVDVDLVFKAGVTGIRALIPAASMPGFLQAYNQALTEMFYITTAVCVVAALLSFALEWRKIEVKADQGGSAQTRENEC